MKQHKIIFSLLSLNLFAGIHEKIKFVQNEGVVLLFVALIV